MRLPPARQSVRESKVSRGVGRQEWQEGRVKQTVVVLGEVC
jgi:hypothetical protein